MDKASIKKELLKRLKEVMMDDDDVGMEELLQKKKGLKKVTVASDSEEGLQEGLEKASELLEDKGKNKKSKLDELFGED